MRLLIALRLLSEQHAKPGIESCSNGDQPKGKLIDANVTRHHPALKNISSYLASAGQLPEIRKGHILRAEGGKPHIEREADFRLYWCEIETELAAEYWYGQREVEVVIPKDGFTKLVSSIRHKSGANYVEACEQYARTLHISVPEQVGYRPPSRSSDRAA